MFSSTLPLSRRLLQPSMKQLQFSTHVKEIRKVGVVGLGLMGHGVAQVSAMAGYEVTHSLTHSLLTHPLTHSRTILPNISYSFSLLPHYLTHTLTHSLTHCDSLTATNSLTHSLTILLTLLHRWWASSPVTLR
jgi:hypothetical protein